MPPRTPNVADAISGSVRQARKRQSIQDELERFVTQKRLELRADAGTRADARLDFERTKEATDLSEANRIFKSAAEQRAISNDFRERELTLGEDRVSTFTVPIGGQDVTFRGQPTPNKLAGAIIASGIPLDQLTPEQRQLVQSIFDSNKSSDSDIPAAVKTSAFNSATEAFFKGREIPGEGQLAEPIQPEITPATIDSSTAIGLRAIRQLSGSDIFDPNGGQTGAAGQFPPERMAEAFRVASKQFPGFDQLSKADQEEIVIGILSGKVAIR